jgi:hypothetical protein
MREPAHKVSDGTAKVTQDGDTLHCPCGSLIARLVPDGVELKCRRCKRIIVIPLEASSS